MSVQTLQAPAAPAPAGSANKDWLRALERTARINETPTRILAVVIDELADRLGEAPALLSDRETLSYAALADRSRRYARWALDQGLAKGDVVALMMPNRPEYLAVWLGLTRVGVVVALINTSLRGASLRHCLKIAEARRTIVDADLLAVFEESSNGEGDVWVHGEAATSHPRIDLALAAMPIDGLAGPETAKITLLDPALLIYTSGTTGLPKAARVSHHRIISWSGWFAGLMDTQPSDRLYNCLPLCHSAGGVAATGAALIAGASVVIAEKFSASRFWDDIARWDCTLFQYIGELCRYLLAAPPQANETAHRLRIACGNGLQADVWTAFQDRFAIPRVLEFYAATEGTFSLYNVEGRPGAIGKLPSFLAHRFPAAIVRFNPETGAPARDEAGFCIPCARGEAGEAIGRISEGAAGRFEGYTDADESQKKILRDVFIPGDAWMRTGDLMVVDAQGYWFFRDRIGDTFRWKGENVATTEVAQAILASPGVSAASVYGVKVSGRPGRAGMAAVVAGPGFDLGDLRARLAMSLPEYARPVFVRLVDGFETTETFKPKKQALADEGFDPARTDDPLFVDDRIAGAYVRLDAARFEAILSGALRL